MLITDLKAHVSLGDGVRLAHEAPVLRVVTGCAQTELMDPTPFLSVGELVLTTGMGLRFTDQRTWDAYVERLVRAQVSGLVFALGRVHPVLPAGLLAAARHHGLALLEVSADVPLLMLSRHVWQELAAERYATMRTGWELADDCARLATEGDSLLGVLGRISSTLGADVTLVEPDGFALASTRAGEGEGVDPRVPRGGRSVLNLPGGPHEKFKLQVDGLDDSTLLQPLLGPVAAVLAMQLSYTLASRSPLHSQAMASLMQALLDPRGGDRDELVALVAATRFVADEPWATVTLSAAAGRSAVAQRRAAWRLRVGLESSYRLVRFFEDPGHTTFLMQQPVEPVDLRAVILESLPAGGATGVWFEEGLGLAELGLVVQLGRRREPAEGVLRGPRLDLAGIVEALPAAGLHRVASRLLAPLDDDPTGALRLTLDSYLRHSGSVRDVCQELFIHRNTLAYRMRRIGELLRLDLADGTTRAVCLMALRITSAPLAGRR